MTAPPGFAPHRPEPYAGPRLNLLVAYPYVTKEVLAGIVRMGPNVRWLMDSGAFTAFKGGRPIALDDYLRFIDGLPVTPWRYFSLDVITDTIGSHANYEAMRKRGYDPIPVVTREGPEVLDLIDAYHRETDVVALGGMVGKIQKPEPYIKAVMAHARGRRFHLLGFTRYDWLGTLRPFSADSSSWESAARYGVCQVYLGRGKFASYDRKASREGPPSPAICARLRAWGFDPYALRTDAGWAGDDSMARWVSVCSVVAASVDLEKHTHTRQFLALAANRVDLLASALAVVTGAARGDVERNARLMTRVGRGNRRPKAPAQETPA